MRTNIELDDELIERAMKVYQVPTKRAIVELALQRLVESMARKEKLAMEGTGWEGDLGAMREDASARRRRGRE
ncbi:MAG TPA: type II toxin-antitoxin system VapB family antitoxin [Polyangia bacterium]